MNKILLLILILLHANSCSIKKKQGNWNKDKTIKEKVQKLEVILTKQAKKENELNPALEIKFLEKKLSNGFANNQNNIGQLMYDGKLEKIGKYKFSKFDDFEYVDVQPVFYNEYVIFSDSKGTIILYDENQKKK